MNGEEIAHTVLFLGKETDDEDKVALFVGVPPAADVEQ